MPRTRRVRYTISQWMILTAAVACVLALLRPAAWSRAQVAAEVAVAASLLMVIVLTFVFNGVVESIFGIQCPACRRWTLRRLARHRRYYRCSACRARFYRAGLGPWHDASGPDEDVMFRGDVEARAWRGFATPADPGDTTSGQLLQNKRRRHAGADDAPAGAGDDGRADS
jgi:hypothetical protein